MLHGINWRKSKILLTAYSRATRVTVNFHFHLCVGLRMNICLFFLNIWMLQKSKQIDMDSPVKAQKTKAAVAPPAALDGGYAWFILVSCFLVFGLTFGVIKSFGVFYVEIHQYFETSASDTSWITSIAVATIHIIGNYHNLFPLIYICVYIKNTHHKTCAHNLYPQFLEYFPNFILYIIYILYMNP